ncbi:polysaccharide pyruvyl transferase family protein [Clostridium perfringens]|uniref:polysaccharide pyruvyl transferase family protein n=1 Tax=Clostridium perfringens TaxID=1502 RepID=UPI001CC60674|nr:polysaccharide pyruvyl transferase family protein [Clostridium perfringens]MDM0608549.1 polysaccharide pyruvyl transferase family protein [Clostridium perfringens]UUW66454.1 polysaccharide pyruvyl transferase family protein [Clostridium perfringens]CAG9355515.1 polysaccharide pyruvyl transferase CsaB [Clostridium perfringens]
MKKILLFDTSVATLNMGDEVIMNSIKNNMADFLENTYCISMPTHTLNYSKIQSLLSPKTLNEYKNVDYKFVCGTNLLYTNMLRPIPGWNIKITNTEIVKDSVLLGVGHGVNSKKVTLYTKLLYNRVLSKKYYHSTRDEKTKIMLENMGFKAINTGCPTLWGLTDSHCKDIPKEKSNSVIFTLTSYKYAQDREKDKKMIDILRKNYENIFFWPQAIQDLEYLKELNEDNGVKIVSPNLKNYEKILSLDIDYVGSRLHGGIFALQNKKRAIILAIDYRAREMKKTYSIPCIERDEVDSKLDNIINSNFETKITGLDFELINKWLKQFK